MSIRIHIDRLILDGFPLTAGQGRLVQAAVERELTRLIGNRRESGDRADGDMRGERESGGPLPALLQKGGAAPAASAGPFQPPAAASPSQLGSHIARSVYGGLGSRK